MNAAQRITIMILDEVLAEADDVSVQQIQKVGLGRRLHVRALSGPTAEKMRVEFRGLVQDPKNRALAKAWASSGGYDMTLEEFLEAAK